MKKIRWFSQKTTKSIDVRATPNDRYLQHQVHNVFLCDMSNDAKKYKELACFLSPFSSSCTGIISRNDLFKNRKIYIFHNDHCCANQSWINFCTKTIQESFIKRNSYESCNVFFSFRNILKGSLLLKGQTELCSAVVIELSQACLFGTAALKICHDEDRYSFKARATERIFGSKEVHLEVSKLT